MESANDGGPGSLRAERSNAGLQFGLEHEGKEAAEHVSADRLVKLVEDRPCGQQVLRCAESVVVGPEWLVAEHRDQRVEIGVGTQHKEPVEPGVLVGFCAIDGKVATTHRLEEAPIARITHQRLVTAVQLPLQCGQYSSARGSVLCRLLMVDADNVACPAQGER